MQGNQELRTTRFSDVCGSVDELKRLMREEQVPDPQVMAGLLKDMRYMLEHMGRRLQEYAHFEQEAEILLERIRSLGHFRLDEGLSIASQVDASLESGQPTEEVIEVVCAQAEQIRDVANEQECQLRQAREAAIALYRLYACLRGKRDWRLEEGADDTATTSDRTAGLAARLDSWLPPSPHREHILDYLADGRAFVVPPDGERKEPYVAFESGGGGMPLRHVRWSDSVRNFYPVGQEPNPAGRQQRNQ
ncbi:MAG: hypothetical protein AABZ06_02975 [Bdellovibrionota bacterium]